MPGLLDNEVTAPDQSFSTTQQLQYANCFVVSAPVQLAAVQWYAASTAANRKPTSIRLHNFTDNVTVRTWATIPDAASAGWQQFDPGDMPALETGKEYRLSWTTPTSGGMPFWGTDRTTAPPAPFQWAADASKQTAGIGVPNSAWTGGAAVSVTSEAAGPTPPAEPPATEPNPGTLDPGGSLPYWLHQDTTNPDSLPKLTYEYLIAYAESTGIQWDNINAILGTASSSTAGTPPTAMGRLGLILVLLEALPGIASNVADLWGKLFPGGTTLEDLAALVATLEGNVSSNIGRDHIPLPGSGWLKRAETFGAGPATWDEPADRYVWTMTNPSARTPGIVINGINYFLHRGWWAPLNISLVGNHRTFVGQAHEFYEVGQRLPGVIFFVEEDIEWTLEAYDYSPGA